MKKTTLWIAAPILATCAIYLISGGADNLLQNGSFWTWRHETVIFSGLISLVFMSVCMVIALRPKWVDRLTGGLDKAYGLHKWMGIGVTVTLVLHWLSENLPKWLYSTGWFPARVKHAALADPTLLDSMRGVATETGEWAFYIFVALSLIALMRKIPYRYFRYVHKAFPLVFLAGAFHSVVLVPREWWSTPAGMLVVAVAAVGAVAAVISLLQRIGASRQVGAEVTSIEKHDNGLIDVELDVPGKGFSHAAGQFAFVTFSPDEGPHPFTLASSGKNPNRVRFAIKALGDYTNTLADRLHTGQKAVIEGPYGQFTFNSSHAKQVWVAGGIGVTPFMARLEALALEGKKVPYPVDFWYCTGTAQDATFPRNLDELCKQTGVALHRMRADEKQYLNAATIRRAVPDLKDTSVWFCGPSGFARNLLDGLKTFGMPAGNFHNERFNMR